MPVLRNKELRKTLVLALISIITSSIIALWIDVKAGILLLVLGILLTIFFIRFTIYLYRQVDTLSIYLKRIRQGEHSLDIRDNEEGELSILKNEIYKVTSMLSEYNERLRSDKVLLADHMADISHQLKTPLTSMMVMVDLLRDEDLPQDRRRQFTSSLYSQLERIQWLVTSLLTISKLDTGVVEMNPADVKAGDLITSALEPLLISLEIKEITSHIKGEHYSIYCDFHWTSEALLNILKNCMEHTGPGGKLFIEASDNPLFSQIIIKDTGVGIPKEDLPHIFTRFYRGKKTSKDSVGIGLSMSKSILRIQDGDITVESQEGKGSSFIIRLYKSII